MDVLIIGAGGHAKVVIEAFRAAGMLRIVGIVDPHPSSSTVLGVPVIGTDTDLPRLRREGIERAFIAIGNNRLRQGLGAQLTEIGYTIPTAIHPAALLSPSARIGAGVVVMARAVIGTESVLHDFVIVNTGAVIDHDNVVEVAAHVAPGCALAGAVRVGARSLIGVGSAIRPGIHIGADVVVGAGSAVVANIGDGAVVGGVPARPLAAAPVAR